MILTSAGGVWWCEPLEWWCVQAPSSICLDLAKSLMTLPIRPCLCDLFRRARNKIPPHQDRLWKRRSTNQQYSTSVSALELDNGSTRPEIPQTRRIDRLTIDLYIACQ